MRKFVFDKNQTTHYEKFGISQCSKTVAVVQYPIQNNRHDFYGVLSLIDVENGTFQKYRFFLPFSNAIIKRVVLLHSSVRGWMFSVTKMINSSKVTNDVYQFVFNETEKDCELKFLTTLPKIYPCYLDPFIGDKYLFLFTTQCDSYFMYNLQLKLWCSENAVDNSVGKCDHFVMGSEDGQCIYIVPAGLNLTCRIISGNHQIYKMNDACCWIESGVSIDSFCFQNHFKTAFCTRDILFLNPTADELAVFISTSVHSLQDIAFKSIFTHCKSKGVPLKQLIEYANMPVFMKRRYFGPTWFEIKE